MRLIVWWMLVGLAVGFPTQPPPGSGDGKSFEEALKRLNKQFETGGGSGGTGGGSDDGPDGLLGGLPRQSESNRGFSASFGIGVSTAAWTEEPPFTCRPPSSSNKPPPGSHNPGDLQAQYSSLLNDGITFFATSETEKYSEEMLGIFHDSSTASSTAR